MRGKPLGAEGSPTEGKGPTCRLGEGDHLLIPGLDDLSRSCLSPCPLPERLAGMDGNRTHQGHLNSALQTVLKTLGIVLNSEPAHLGLLSNGLKTIATRVLPRVCRHHISIATPSPEGHTAAHRRRRFDDK